MDILASYLSSLLHTMLAALLSFQCKFFNAALKDILLFSARQQFPVERISLCLSGLDCFDFLILSFFSSGIIRGCQ